MYIDCMQIVYSFIEDLITVDLGIFQGPETNPLKYQGTYVP